LFLCNSKKTEFYLLMMPGRKKFVTKELCHKIGSPRLSFAPSEFMERYLNIEPGSVSVMGLMNDNDNNVHLLIDRDVLKSEFIGCHPCVNTSSLRIRTTDLFEKFLPFTGHEPMIVDLLSE
jgi:Ala-tRNA(Pro) deacylase